MAGMTQNNHSNFKNPEEAYLSNKNPHFINQNNGGFGETLKSTSMNQNYLEEADKSSRPIMNQTNQYGQMARQELMTDQYQQEEIIQEKISERIEIAQENIGVMESDEELEVGMEITDQNKNKKNELIIQPIEGPQTNFYYIKDNGGRIGRHSMNEVVIYDESVSRHHAEIIFSEEEFYLRDIGSTTGTYIKIVEKINLEEGMIIEIGSYQFLICEIYINEEMHIENEMNSPKSYVTLEIYDGPEDCERVKHILEEGGSIGRKTNNKIHFTDDLHMSNLHCSITRIGSRFVLEDMASTNGTWLRLSREGEESERKPLYDKSIFKIGNSAMYIAKRIMNSENLENQIGMMNSSKKSLPKDSECFICCENERDCLIHPCRHNVSCMKCTKNLRECPICRVHIEELVKIYKA